MEEVKPLVSESELPEFRRMVKEDLLICAWIPELVRRETYAEAFRRYKKEERAKGTLAGWMEVQDLVGGEK